MNSINTTLLKNWGGGNSLIIINIISRNIFDKIIKSSDLNGCIVPYDVNVWNTANYWNHWISCQDNMKNVYLLYHSPDDWYNKWYNKSDDAGIGEGGKSPFFQINYRE